MSHPVTVNGREGHDLMPFEASPTHITAGGVVVLTATPPTQGTYDVRWTVTGPVRLSEQDTRIVLLGATSVDNRMTVPEDGVIRATLDTSPLSVGSWTVAVTLTRVAGGPGDAGGIEEAELTRPYGEAVIEVRPRPFAAGDDVAVTLKRTAVPATSDQALWVAIRNSTNALGFDSYTRFMDVVMCGGSVDRPVGRLGPRDTRHTLRKVTRRTALPFPNVDRYRLLKAATEV